MVDDLRRRGSGPSHGPTTWTCECGARQVSLEPFRLPLKWMVLTMKVGGRDYMDEKEEERTYCPKCAFDYHIGPTMRRAAKLLKRGR